MMSEAIQFPTYEQQIKVVIGSTLKENCLAYNLPWNEGEDAEMYAYCQKINDCIYIVLRKDNSRKTILHECVHAINTMYADMHAVMDVENDEIYARDVSFLQDAVLNIFENEINSSK